MEKEILEIFEVAKRAGKAAAEDGCLPEVDRCLDALKQLREMPVTTKDLVATQPAKWSFSSYTILKNGEQAPRTSTFAEEMLAAETGEGEGVKPPERSFWAKYWMYLIPLGLIVMNAITQAMNMPEEQAAGQSASQTQQPVAQRAPNAPVRRR